MKPKVVFKKSTQNPLPHTFALGRMIHRWSQANKYW